MDFEEYKERTRIETEKMMQNMNRFINAVWKLKFESDDAKHE